VNYGSLPKSTISETGSDHNGIKSPEVFADERSMTPISEYDIDGSHGHINPFTITSQVRK
jgi:hypothetical protein